MSETRTARDSSIRTYKAKRNFAVTEEPPPASASQTGRGAVAIFVVQKHQAHRAGLHWDFRLEHNGVLWSWAVRKGPSLDPRDKRIAAHVEDHPLNYADFQGTIPDGEYGAGTVELWDRGTWEPLNDPDKGMAKGELTFVLRGERLKGRFHLVRMKPKPRQRGDNWLLFKGHDEGERAGADALTIEREVPRSWPKQNKPPAPGAKRGQLPETQAPQLASSAEGPPKGHDWVSEIKFDGYRLLLFIDHGKTRVVTRNALDWTYRIPALAEAASRLLPVETALLDGELVCLDEKGVSSFPGLQMALSAGKADQLYFYAFDLLHLDGWDLRPCTLIDRKEVLHRLTTWTGMLRYSDHHEGDPGAMLQEVCRLRLEGIISKQRAAPYRPGRSHSWLKVKCANREEFVVLGWTPPQGSRTGLGSLHVGYYDPQGGLHYAGGVGTGFSDEELERLRAALDDLATRAPPDGLKVAGDPLDPSIHWVRPEMVIEVQFAGWSGAGRVRQAVYVGQREDKPADQVVRDLADPEAARAAMKEQRRRPAAKPPAGRVVTARAPKGPQASVQGVTITHADKELWPGITKRDLAEYWQTVSDAALRGLVRRPLAIVRCPDGIAGQHFFQKRGHGSLPKLIRDGEAAGSPYVAIDGLDGLMALVQMASIELHPWGASEDDPLHPDTLVFDLDPGEGVAFSDVVKSAREVRDRLQGLGLTSFCRTTGGKGLHVVIPIKPKADWDEAKAWCHAFAETLGQEQPDRYLTTVKKVDRRGRILLDWLRNGLGA
ncbi:MAG: DNA ligase D, partial [Acetobacteraceae bacterium]|nr:DNA ligase D [Acetobacteraceae bacterium]